MKKFLSGVLAVLFGCGLAGSAQAHFQMIYSPEMAHAKGGNLDLKLVFTHPYEAGHTMNMDTPESFFTIHKGKKKDLLQTLQPITWTSLTNSAQAYETTYKLRGLGDWLFCLKPVPYFEETDGIYIQQIAKAVFNVGGLPTDWMKEVGLEAEIVPLNKPYNMLTGNVFRGIVKADGQPVPFAEIEVEYVNHTPVMAENRFTKEANAVTPESFLWPTTIVANSLGEFSYAMPKAGWWGFCALGVGPQKEFNGKELSQDAVIWVETVDMQ
ncbi:MAG: nickel transporter [Desulfobulbus propionicus]|nr:MAG: nickel transporter [Desulfobulbus propionicus]